MPAKKQAYASNDSLAAGLTASSSMTDIGRTLGRTAPDSSVRLAAMLERGNGWDQVRNTHNMLMGFLFVCALIAGVIYTFKDSSVAGIFGLILVIAGPFFLFAVGFATAMQMTSYVPIRFRARCIPVDEPNIHAGQMLTGHPMTELLFVIPVKVIALLIMLPFWMLGSCLEVLRVIGLNLIGKKASYRGDQGKYYDKVRRQYAKVYHEKGVAAAMEYLRLAYSGLLTPIGVEIPRDQWFGEGYKRWLSPMIERHGPVDMYCTGEPGQSSEQLREMSRSTSDKPDKKYDAI
ncbi:hypothetical protein BTO32_14850 [Marinobacter lutaoensis]|uniref:Uncharacterized protein n=1 Tax=Marinobacter lutaoensis TaxID=135739 RepID=A0A1V2DPR0_9GAMM|nr:hypothetical protein [Marinobacter lutaoensis]ONF42490.1 hypothetical protein BTO32_14850 [Marinobacter lutaoensis]